MLDLLIQEGTSENKQCFSRHFKIHIILVHEVYANYKFYKYAT